MNGIFLLSGVDIGHEFAYRAVGRQGHVSAQERQREGGECGGVAGCIQFFFEGEKQFFDVDFVETQVAEGAVVGQLRDVDAEMVGQDAFEVVGVHGGYYSEGCAGEVAKPQFSNRRAKAGGVRV